RAVELAPGAHARLVGGLTRVHAHDLSLFGRVHRRPRPPRHLYRPGFATLSKAPLVVARAAAGALSGDDLVSPLSLPSVGARGSSTAVWPPPGRAGPCGGPGWASG